MKFIKRQLNEASLFPNVQKIKQNGGVPAGSAGTTLANKANTILNGQITKVLTSIMSQVGNPVPISMIFAMGDPDNAGAFHPKPLVLSPVCNLEINSDGTKTIKVTYRYGEFYKNTARNKVAEKMCISLDKIISLSEKRDKINEKFAQKVIAEIDKIYKTLPASGKYIYDYIKECNIVLDTIQMFVGCSYMKIEFLTGSLRNDGRYDPRTPNGLQNIQDALNKLSNLFDFQCDVDFIVAFMGSTQDRNANRFRNMYLGSSNTSAELGNLQNHLNKKSFYVDTLSTSILKPYSSLKKLEDAAGTPNLLISIASCDISNPAFGISSGKFRYLELHYQDEYLFKYANKKFTFAGSIGKIVTSFVCSISSNHLLDRILDISLQFKKNSVSVYTSFVSKREWDCYDIKKSKKPVWTALEKFKNYLESILP